MYICTFDYIVMFPDPPKLNTSHVKKNYTYVAMYRHAPNDFRGSLVTLEGLALSIDPQCLKKQGRDLRLSILLGIPSETNIAPENGWLEY